MDERTPALGLGWLSAALRDAHTRVWTRLSRDIHDLAVLLIAIVRNDRGRYAREALRRGVAQAAPMRALTSHSPRA